MEQQETVYRYENIQSGDVHYSVIEPEGGDHIMHHITEIPRNQVPQWALSQLED